MPMIHEMAQKNSLPLAGRLAIQLKMLTREEVELAIAQSAASGNPRLGQVFLEMGLLDRAQLAKLQEVQKDLVEKHRAKKAAASGSVAPDAPTPTQSKPPAQTRPSPPREEIHAAAQHAAEAAAPLSARDVEDLAKPPPEIQEVGLERSHAKGPPNDVPDPAPAHSGPPTSVAPATAPAEPPQAQPQPAPAADQESSTHSLELPIPNSNQADRDRLEAILAASTNKGASDIHLHAGAALKHRFNGQFEVLDESIDAEAIEGMVSSSLTPEQRQHLSREGEIDFCFDLPGIGRFRANAYRQQRGLDVVFRTIPEKPPTLVELGLPEELEKYTDYHQGMVLITGPAGCGKSSTLAALVNHINENRDEHVLTVEDPIEIVHPSKRCLVNQRHAGLHTASFSRALRGALREDPDIIVIGELRDLETISLAMTAAETGHFVLATLHTANAVRTVNRMIGAFPSNEQDQVRAMLSESLRAVLSQRLVPTADGQGRLPALELLVINRAIGNLIRDEKTVQIRSSMQTGKAHGMYLLEQSLNEMVANGKITRDVALEIAEEKKLITAGV
jgi:twitching motility protein PilT